MLPTQTAVKIDDPNSEFHGEVGFIKHNPRSGRVEPCDTHNSLQECVNTDCTDAEQLPEDWYVIVFDPMDTGGFTHCTEWFHRDAIVVNGC